MPITASLGALTTFKGSQTSYPGSRYFWYNPSAGPPVGFAWSGSRPYFTDFTVTPGYTLEYWVNYSVLSGTGVNPQCIGSFNTGFSTNWFLFVDNTGRLTFTYTTTTGTRTYSTAAGTISINNWYAIAMTTVNNGTNTTFRFFINGNIVNTRVGTGSIFSSSQTVTTSTISIVSYPFSFQPVTQVPAQTLYYDEVRVSNIARYTANYTVADAQFTSDANTQLLLHFDYNTNYAQNTAPVIDSSSYARNINTISSLINPYQVLTPKVF